MNLRKVIERRIRRKTAGFDLQGDVNAVVAANVNERGATTSVSHHQTVVQRSGRTSARAEPTRGGTDMPDEPKEERDLTEEELESQDGEELPDRETMMILDPGPMPVASSSDLGPIPWSDSENPDDRYEQ